MIVSFLRDDKKSGIFEASKERIIMLKNPLVVFLLTSAVLALVFFMFPINLFDGVIVESKGLSTVKIETPLSLSYFIGIGYDEADMVNIETFYLTLKGKVMAVLFIFGFPALLALRIHSRNS